jgi:hypothetical protein
MLGGEDILVGRLLDVANGLIEVAPRHLSLVKTSSADVGRQIADMQTHNSRTRTAATVFS